MKPLTSILGAALLTLGTYCHAEDLGPNPIDPDLVSEVKAIQAGKPFWIGLWIEHPDTYHTYWKAPGIVGIPTELKWDLPEGFSAGEIKWPVPVRVSMSGHNAHGYHGPLLLMVQITPPDELKSEKVMLPATVTWMCCSKTCHPGFKDVSITLPVDSGADPVRLDEKWHPVFEATREKFPKEFVGWTVEAEESAEHLVFSISPDKDTKQKTTPNPEATSIYFFCGDGHVNSASPQAIRRKPDGTLVLTMERSPFGDDEAKFYEGLLYCGEGWLKGGTRKYGKVSIPRSNPKPFPSLD